MAKGFGAQTPRAGNKDSVRLEELADILKFQDKKWFQLRFIDRVDPLHVQQHWIKILGGKDKREISIPRYCISFDPMNPSEPKDGVNCPYCGISTGKDGAMRTSEFFLFNAIVREIQEEEPAKKAKHTAEETKTGFKDIRSKSWTPVRVIRLTSSLVSRIQELSETNIHKDKKTGDRRQYDATDPRYGFDVNIKYKSDGAGTDKYSCDKVEGGPTPLTAEEKEYLVYELSEELLDKAGRMSEAQAKQDFKRMEIVGDIPEDDEDEDNDRPRKKGKSRALDDDDEDEDEDEVKPAKKKKAVFDDDDEDEPKPKKKRKPVVDEEDEDEDEDEPKPKKKRKPVVDEEDEDAPVRKKKKAVFDDDDDDDEEDKKPVRKRKPSDDDEDDDEDDDSDRAPAKRKSGTSKPSSATKKRKSIDDDEDEPPVKKKRKPVVDDDEDDDDEPAPKRKPVAKTVKAKPVIKKKRPALDDDDDE